MTAFQQIGDVRLNRAWHVWFRDAGRWKCAICGCVTLHEPPAHPEPVTWFPETYELLTDAERQLAPFREAAGARK